MMDFASKYPTVAPLSPISTASGSLGGDLYTPSVDQLPSNPLGLSILETESSVRFFIDEAALVREVLEMLPEKRRLMVAIHPQQSSAPPTLNFVTSRLPPAVESLFVLAPSPAAATGFDDALRVAVAVLVLPEVADVVKVCSPGVLGPLVTVTSFDSPLSPYDFNDLSVAEPKETPQRHDHHEAPMDDLLSIDDIYTTTTGSTGVCAVLTLNDVKNLLPPTEAECRARVLMVKRCHRLGNRCSTRIKAYFDALLGKKDAVEHVLMLPLKSRCPSKCGRPVPPKTGFVVFREAADAMLARSIGSDQMVNNNAVIRVETYDGF
ncbi:hypothetical protein FOZ60_002541 [Perkinsus olseni]|uniref:Uncharacterized protein n=1 Tax=Perkinsus olseni TaxID=32597 RepID=A0A7J6NXJ4_PEROL|nr:hypothetical protein FOZ60_002541 [Perkinsus olseni]